MSPNQRDAKRFRLPWGTMASDVEQIKRLEKEQEAEDLISSFSGRSLTIQRAMIEKIWTKEKRKVKFGLSSGKLMDLAIRRYSYRSVPVQVDNADSTQVE